MSRLRPPRLRTLARQYLAHRRACGYRMQTEEYVLRDFTRYAERTAPGRPITTALALQWIAQRSGLRAVTRANRLDTLRAFARFCHPFDPRTEIPPTGLSSRVCRRRAPYIVTAAEVRLIMRRAGKVRANGSTLRPQTLQALIGLIACTGLRINEALRLRCEDLDLHSGTLHVARAKFSPERDLPLHPSTLRALDRYRRLRQRHYPNGAHLFIGPHGRPMQGCAASWTLRHLVHDFPPRGDRPRPRFHDLRHSLATHLIARWSQEGAPIAHRLLLLSRYLGHKHFHNTYWYIEPHRAALQAAATRFERFHSTTKEDT